MKKFIKNNIKIFLIVLITTIIVGNISVYAASQYFAKDITFTPTNENFKKENGEPIDNVEDALNELYKYQRSDFIEVEGAVDISLSSLYQNNAHLSYDGKYCYLSASLISAIPGNNYKLIIDDKYYPIEEQTYYDVGGDNGFVKYTIKKDGNIYIEQQSRNRNDWASIRAFYKCNKSINK